MDPLCHRVVHFPAVSGLFPAHFCGGLVYSVSFYCGNNRDSYMFFQLWCSQRNSCRLADVCAFCNCLGLCCLNYVLPLVRTELAKLVSWVRPFLFFISHFSSIRLAISSDDCPMSCGVARGSDRFELMFLR